MLNYKSRSDYFNFQVPSECVNFYNTIYPYFELVKDRSVLEIGPFLGAYSSIIVSYGPKSFTMVENNLVAVQELRKIFPEFEVVHDDIFQFLKKDICKFDVVVCCGVLYHFHSPLYLLELIANYADPDFLIIEFLNMNETSVILDESSNQSGNRFTSTGWKYIDKSILISDAHMTSSIEQLGYRSTVQFLPVPPNKNKPLFKERMIFNVYEKVKND